MRVTSWCNFDDLRNKLYYAHMLFLMTLDLILSVPQVVDADDVGPFYAVTSFMMTILYVLFYIYRVNFSMKRSLRLSRGSIVVQASAAVVCNWDRYHSLEKRLFIIIMMEPLPIMSASHTKIVSS